MPSEPASYSTQSYPTQPYSTQPYSTQPYSTQPTQSYPTQAYPTQAAQSYSTQPYSTQPAESYPAQPNQAYPGQPYQAQSNPAQPYPAQPYPSGVVSYPTPPKKSHVGLIVGIVVAVVVIAVIAVTGGVLFALKGKNTTTTAAPSTAASASPSASQSSAPDHSGNLRRFLVPPPAGSKPWSDPLGSHNSFTAKQDAAQWGSAKQWRLSLLNTHDFQAGAVREWDQLHTSVQVELFKFPLPNNAAGFFEDDTTDADYFDKPSTQVLVGNVPGGRAYYTKVKDKYGNLHAFAAATCGDVVMEIWIDQYRTSPLSYAKTLLHKQYALLCP